MPNLTRFRPAPFGAGAERRLAVAPARAAVARNALRVWWMMAFRFTPLKGSSIGTAFRCRGSISNQGNHRAQNFQLFSRFLKELIRFLRRSRRWVLDIRISPNVSAPR